MKDYFTEDSSGVCVCEELEASRIQVFLKQTQRHGTSG